MRLRWSAVLLAFGFGILLPALLVALIRSHGREENIQSISNTTLSDSDEFAAEADTITVLHQDGTIQNMKLDDYLTCVILREMPAKFEVEALKAQSVVARTYVLKRRNSNSKHATADICASSSCCQGFCSEEEYMLAGGNQENIDKIRNAVLETSGEIILYDGKLIDATYFSCSGGMTEDAVAVWGKDIPYLRATDSPGEESAKHYIDTVTIPLDEFMDALSLQQNEDGRITIDKVTYTAGGGIDKVTISGTEITGTTMRKKLDLNSTAIILSVVGESVTITTKGNGHRVGMSQYGANAMALDGATYQEILQHYYSGTEIAMYIAN